MSPKSREPRSHAFPKKPADAESALPASHTPQRVPKRGKARVTPPAADLHPGATEENRYRPGDSNDKPLARRLPDDREDAVDDEAGGSADPATETSRRPMTDRSIRAARQRRKNGGAGRRR